MIDRALAANTFIREGNFDKARKIYFDLLDHDPEDQAYIAGFFISSYWDNRLDLVLRIKEGKERGRKLVSQYEEFDRQIRERKYPLADAYHAATQCILGEASLQFRLAYQKEGSIGLDPGVLTELAFCLIRTGDYRNADDVLAYASTLNKTPTAQIIFYRAECNYFLGNEEAAKSAYTEGFLIDPSAIRLEIIHSEPLHSAIEKVRHSFELESDVKEYLPVYLLENRLLPVIERNNDEVRFLYREMLRFHESLKKKSGFQFKLTCRILQIALHIIENTEPGSEFIEKTEQILEELDPEFLSRYRST